MNRKRLTTLIAIVVIMAIVLSGCQKSLGEYVSLRMGWHRIPNLLVQHEAMVLGYLTVGDGVPDTAQTEGDESLYVEGAFETDGAADFDGALDADTTGAISLDADLASNFNTSVGDLTLEAETGSVIIKGDEAVADAIYLDANDAITTGITAIVGTAGTFGVTGYIADFNMTGGVSIDADLASNFSTSVGDITIDAETGSVNIIGSEATNNSVYIDANDTVTSGVDIDTGTTSGLRIDGGPLSIDGTGAFNINTASGDITVEAETGSVTIKGDEGAADAIHLDGDQTAGGGVTIAANTGGVDVNLTATGPFAIDGDMLIVGNAGADGDVAVGDNDALVVGVLEVDGELEADGAIDADAGISVAGGSLDVDDAVDVDGSSDEVQLAVTSYTTQTTDLVQFDGGLVDIGGGTYTLADGDNELGIAGDLEVEGVAYLDGGAEVNGTLTLEQDATIVNSETNVITFTVTTAEFTGSVNVATDLDVNGTTNLDAVDIDDAVQIDGATTVGVDGTAFDVILYSDTEGDYFHWDQSTERLIITGTDSANALEIPDGDVSITDDLEVDGISNLDAMDVDGNANWSDASYFLPGPRLEYTACTTDTTLSATHNWRFIDNFGGSASGITITLWDGAAAEGTMLCIFNNTGVTLTVAPKSGDADSYIRFETNAHEDKIQSTTAGDVICLYGINEETQWLPWSVIGTWADINH